MNEYSVEYCKYNSEIPSSLVNRPRILIFTAKDVKGQHIECINITKATIKSKSQSQDGCRYLIIEFWRFWDRVPLWMPRLASEVAAVQALHHHIQYVSSLAIGKRIITLT